MKYYIDNQSFLAIKNMSTHTINLTPSVHQYLLQHSVHENDALRQLREKTAGLPGAAMQISPEQGQFMTLLIKLLNAKKTLDIGTYTGYSALVVAKALPANGKVIACDVDPRATDIAKEFWQNADVANKIDLRLAPAMDTLKSLIDNGESCTFDFAFIDADKDNYSNYYELSLQLLRPGGLIAVDNVLWDGKVADSNNNDKTTLAIRKLNKLIYQDSRVIMSMIPIGDGLTLAMKL